MPTPLGSLTCITASGDVVTGPGCPTKLAKGLPISCVGDAVAGATCSGVISSSTATNKVFQGRPVSDISSQVTGINPATAAPVSTAIGQSPNTNNLF